MKNPNSKDNPCITSDPTMLTGDAFVQHRMKLDQAMETGSEKMTTRSKARREIIWFSVLHQNIVVVFS
jgi:hypothetical protein